MTTLPIPRLLRPSAIRLDRISNCRIDSRWLRSALSSPGVVNSFLCSIIYYNRMLLCEIRKQHTLERFSFRVQYNWRPTRDAPMITNAASAVSWFVCDRVLGSARHIDIAFADVPVRKILVRGILGIKTTPPICFTRHPRKPPQRFTQHRTENICVHKEIRIREFTICILKL